MKNKKPQLALVTSGKLLRRMALKGVIAEPALVDRPALPSLRKWGGSRGYCYVAPLPGSGAFRFEGFDYVTVALGGRSYLYRVAESNEQTKDLRGAQPPHAGKFGAQAIAGR
jgi:hypothetical protein